MWPPGRHLIIPATLLLVAFMFLFSFAKSDPTNSFVGKDHSQDLDKCEKSCGGKGKMLEEKRKANVLCYVYIEHKITEFDVQPPCVIECLGIKPAKDQGKCVCDMCKYDGQFHFCKEPGKGSIPAEECETHACTGKAKPYTEDICDAEPPPED